MVTVSKTRYVERTMADNYSLTAEFMVIEAVVVGAGIGCYAAGARYDNELMQGVGLGLVIGGFMGIADDLHGVYKDHKQKKQREEERRTWEFVHGH